MRHGGRVRRILGLAALIAAAAAICPPARASECKKDKVEDKHDAAEKDRDASLPKGVSGINPDGSLQNLSFGSHGDGTAKALAAAKKCVADFNRVAGEFGETKRSAKSELKKAEGELDTAATGGDRAEMDKAEKRRNACRKAGKKAEDEEKKAKKSAAQCQAAADQLQDQKDKDNDREKKLDQADKGDNKGGGDDKKGDDKKGDDKGGGGSPPQGGSPQQGGDDKKPDQTPEPAKYPEKLENPIADQKAEEAKTADLRGDKDEAKPGVGFGNTDPRLAAAMASGLKKGGEGVGYYGSPNVFPPYSTTPDRIRGDHVAAATNALGNAGGPGGGGLGGGSSDGSTAAKERGAEEKARTSEEANPFLVSNGGGRLGVPGGKGEGVSDSHVDASATSTFKQDFPAQDRAPAAVAAPETEEQQGYTLFKMVRYRYEALKKKGLI